MANDINELVGSSFVRVKLVTFVHFVFVVNAMLGLFIPAAYLFYNILFFAALFWAMHCKDSAEAVQAAVFINGLSILFDLVCICIFFTFMNGWTVAFSILNLLLRPISTFLLHKEFTERGGQMPVGGQIFPVSQQQRNYQDIDRPNQPIPTNSPTNQNVSSIY